MADQIQPGDRVQLKSGGPVMTVTEIDGSNYWVQYFDNKQELKGAIFPAHALKKVQDSGGISIA